MFETILIAMQQNLYTAVLFLPKLIAAFVIVYVGFKLQPKIRRTLKTLFATYNYDQSLEKFLLSFLGVLYKVIVVLTALSVAGFQTASIVAALGAAGFAVGLALQASMSNLASGILILSLKPIKVGETIEIATKTGTVLKIDMFNTVLITKDNKMIVVPNSQITSQIVTNISRKQVQNKV